MKPIHSLARHCWLACALVSGAATAETVCNKQPVKAEHTEAIGRDMIVNGTPTSVWGLEFAGSPDDVSNEFREFWTREDVPARGKRSDSGWLLTALDTPCQYVLTLPTQAGGGRTRGLLSVMRLSGEAVRRQIADSAIPVPERGKVVSDVESHDPGLAGRTLLIEIPGRAADNAPRYATWLAAQGWSTVAGAPAYATGGSQQINGQALVMQHAGDRLDVIFSDRNGHTEAVVNLARNR